MKPQLDAEKAALEKLTRQLGERQKEVAAIVARRDALEELLTKTTARAEDAGAQLEEQGASLAQAQADNKTLQEALDAAEKKLDRVQEAQHSGVASAGPGATTARAARPGAPLPSSSVQARALAERVDACKRAVQCSRDEAAHWRRVATGSLLDGLDDLPSAVHPGEVLCANSQEGDDGLLSNSSAEAAMQARARRLERVAARLSLIHISEPTRPY